MPNNIKNTTMKIVEYLKNNLINFVLGKTDKDKGFIPIWGNSQYANDINKAKILFEKNQKYIEKTMKLNMSLYEMGQDYNTTFIDTNEWLQLDCDIKNDEEYEKLTEAYNLVNLRLGLKLNEKLNCALGINLE